MNIVSAIAPFFCLLIVFWVASYVAVSDAARDRTALEKEGGRIEFFMNRRSFWAVYLILAFMSYPILAFVATGFNSPMGFSVVSICSACILLLLMALPATIFINGEGLEQSFWVGPKKRIQWTQVQSIVLDEKKKRMTITGSNGHKIVHSRQLPDRARLLAELQTHCPDNVPVEVGQKVLIGK